MLANLREKLLNVNLFNTADEPKTVINEKINLNAGANVLQQFQNNWEELHKNNEDNAKNAEIVAIMIDKLSGDIDKNKENVKLLTNIVTNYHLSDNISNCLKAVNTLYETAENVERNLIELEQIIDEVEFQKLKSQHQFHLYEYEKRKEENFERQKISLQLEHSKKIKEYETSMQKQLEERQKVFQDAFKSDLET